MNKEEISNYFLRIETNRLLINQIKTEEDVQFFMYIISCISDKVKFETNYFSELYKINIKDFVTYRNNKEFWLNLFLNNKIIVFNVFSKTNGELIAACFCEFLSDEIVHIECILNNDYSKDTYLNEALLKIIQTLDFLDVQQFIVLSNTKDVVDCNFNKRLGFCEVDIKDIYYSIDTIAFHEIFKRIQKEKLIVFTLPIINPNVFKYIDEAKDTNGQNEKEELYLKVLELEPNIMLAKAGLAWAKLEQGNPEEAISIFNQILRLKPKKFTSLLGRANAYSDIGSHTEAISDYLEYLGLGFDDDNTYVLLGDSYFHLKEYNKALSSYEFAIKLNPHNKIAKINKLRVEYIINQEYESKFKNKFS